MAGEYWRCALLVILEVGICDEPSCLFHLHAHGDLFASTSHRYPASLFIKIKNF